MKKSLLTITIPTYNRVNQLKVCLDILLCQIRPCDPVDILVSDNHSNDGTEKLMEEYVEKHRFIRYRRNHENLGMDGNVACCVSNAEGEYLAFLSDDDQYIGGAIKAILDVIKKGPFGIICLNYYSFIDNPKVPLSVFVPETDCIMKRGIDLLSYPSVGHFSGLILTTQFAKEALRQMVEVRKLDFKGIRKLLYLEIAARCAALSSDPAFFIGRRFLANSIPPLDKTDYGLLKHLCLDYIMIFQRMYEDKLINDDDYERFARIALQHLPKLALVSSKTIKNFDEIKDTINGLDKYFGSYIKYKLCVKPLISLIKFRFSRLLVKNFITFYKFVKFRMYFSLIKYFKKCSP